MRSWGSWVSEIRAPNQKTRIWLGSYSTAEAAARAYDAALFIVKGSINANFNFPEILSSDLLNYHPSPNANMMSPKSIQRVAAAAAANTNPHSTASLVASAIATTSSSTSTSSSSSETSERNVLEDNSWAELGAFQTLKYDDDMLNAWTMCGYSQLEDCEEDGDIRLWSFC